MPMTLEQLKQQLSSIDADEATFAGLGPSEVPLLDTLVGDLETWLAARAIFALSQIRSTAATAILARSAADPRPEIRVAVAASTKNLPPTEANGILLQALNDRELGVRKFAIRSVAPGHSAPVQARLRELEAGDPAPSIREAARSKLSEIRPEP
jgi:HEAT repeat protein